MATTSFAGLLAVSALTLAGVTGGVSQNSPHADRTAVPLGKRAGTGVGGGAKSP